MLLQHEDIKDECYGCDVFVFQTRRNQLSVTKDASSAICDIVSNDEVLLVPHVDTALYC